jgi:hypothetical protein
VGSRVGLNTEATRKILSPLPGIDPRSPGRPVRSQTDGAARFTAMVHKQSKATDEQRSCKKFEPRFKIF